MRVVHVCAYFAPAFVYGGPPRSILALCRAQRAAGVDVRVVTTTADGDGELREEITSRGDYDGIPVRYCGRTWPRSIFYAPSLPAILATELKDDAVLHIHGAAALMAPQVCRVGHRNARCNSSCYAVGAAQLFFPQKQVYFPTT